ncbi:MAG: Flp pilus assembly protein CpaB [Phycisphaerales bacterium]|nr:Flp pilus assembly protein CpaB [Phycisphaerales bacterium]
MKKIAIIPLVMGVAIGGLAIKLGLSTIQKAKASASVQSANVVVAVEEISATSTIEARLVKVISTPVTPLMGKDSYTKAEDIIGRVAATTIPRGAVVRGELLAPEGTPAGLTVRIPSGYRAVSVKIDEVTGVAYQLQPNSWVDVIVVMDVQNGRQKETISRILLQEVEVIAVGRTLTTGDDPEGKGKVAKSITLLVKDSDVPSLHLAQTRGKLTLAMRSPEDHLMSKAGQATESELLGRSKPVADEDEPEDAAPVAQVAPRPQPESYMVSVMGSDGQQSMVTFNGKNSTVRQSVVTRGGVAASSAPGHRGLLGATATSDSDEDSGVSSVPGFPPAPPG